MNEKKYNPKSFEEKIWNMACFVIKNFDEKENFTKVDALKFSIADKWILARMNSLIKEVTDIVEKFEIEITLQKIYDFIGDEFCDWYIELVKTKLYDKDSEARIEAQYVLNLVLMNSMKLLHPYMPFIAEKIYKNLIHEDENIMILNLPKFDKTHEYPKEEQDMTCIINCIKAIRSMRIEMNVTSSKKTKIIFVTESNDKKTVIEQGIKYFEKLASASHVIIQSDLSNISKNAVSEGVPGIEIFIPLEELLDIEREIERLEKEKENLEEELERVNSKLLNKAFTGNAPEKVVSAEKDKQQKYKKMYDKVVEKLKFVKN